MDIFELIDTDGQCKKYRGFEVKPKVDDLIKIISIPKYPSDLGPYRSNTFDHLSIEKVYKVYKVLGIHQVLIRDDINESVHLTKNQYQIVEEISDKEIELLKQQNEMLGIINTMIRSKVK
jgi:hypothetical protein